MHLSTRWILSVLFLTLSFQTVYGQLVAGFTASPASGCAPLVVAFTNTTSPVAGTTYSWNMGNGSGPITLTDPGASFLTTGTYTVTLTASNGGGTSTFSRVITVFPSPVIDFAANETVVCPGTSVTFTNTTVAGVPGPVTYLWSSGDGYTGTGSTYVHTYSLPGRFNVTLNATNANGCAATLTKTAYMHVLTPPVAGFRANTRLICNPSGTISFSDSSLGSGPFTYRWTFGDGSPASTLANPSHFYTNPGRYTVELTVTDAAGCKDTIAIAGYINVSRLVAAFTGPDSACVNTRVTFANTSTGHTSSYWTYGDGNSSYGDSGSNVYLTKRVHMVRLVVADSFCTDTVSHPFLVPISNINFTITPDSPCPAPVVAYFAANVPAGSAVLWHFGDSSISTGINTVHTYPRNKFDTVQMIVTSGLGCKDTATKVYKIYDLLFSYSSFPNEGCIPLNVKFGVGKKTSLPPPLFHPYPYGASYKWDFGDGSPIDSISEGPSHVYTAVGVYPFSTTILTDNGCTETRKDTVRAGTPPQAAYSATPTYQCYSSNNIKLTRWLISGPADRYFWLFSDGWTASSHEESDTAPVRDVFHHLPVPGLFSGTLTAYYNGCPDTFVRKNYIFIDSPKAKPASSLVCSLANTVACSGSASIGANTYTWLFGDGSTATGVNAMHTYSVAGSYTIKLIVHNVTTGCSDIDSVIQPTDRPGITFSTPDTAICKGGHAVITASTPPPGHTAHYTWIPGGHFYYQHQKTIVDTYHNTGTYSISLIVRDKYNCVDTVVRTNYIRVVKPVAHFRSVSPGFCAPQTVAFTDSTMAWPGTFIANYSWAFGDGGSASSGSPTATHTYVSGGTFNIAEIVTDNIGCKDTAYLPLVTVNKPMVSFSTNTNSVCAPGTITFTNTSTAPATYKWSFGDGTTSTVTHPVHIYTDSGRYTVKLVVTDARGCKDSVTYPKFITVIRPDASFYMSDSVSVCPPFTVRFRNTGSGSGSNYWIFGDGNTSSAANPTNIYTVPGYDTVMLIVTGGSGCKDTAIGHVKVFGYAGAFTYSADSGCTPLRIFFDADMSNVSLASTITWDFADGVTSSGVLSDTISHAYLVPGAYLPKLIISDHVGCVSSSRGLDTIKADGVNPGFTATPNPVCIRTPVWLADTSTSYWSRITAWHWLFDTTSSNLASAAVTYTATGTYAVVLQVTDGWGCTGSATKNITVYELPDITSMPDTVICMGGVTILNDSVGGGVWTSGNSAVAMIGSLTGIVTGVNAGVAAITYTVGSTCYTTTTVTVNTYPDPGTIAGAAGVCVGDSITLTDTVAGGTWSTRTGKASIAAGGLLKGVVAGMDTVIYTVANVNCPATANKLITVYALPDPGVITGEHAICRDALITMTESKPGGKWRIGDTAIATIDSNTGVVNSVGLGTVTITYTVAADINGCVNFITFPLSVINPDFTIRGHIEGVKCFGGADGSIDVTVNGGAPPFRFLWSTGSTFSLTDHLAAGMYSVSIVETQKQCTMADTFYIVSPDSLSVASEIDNDVCNKPNGRIKLTAAGGTAPYQFLWFNDATGDEVSGLSRGRYKCTLTDMNGCRTNIFIVVEDSTCPEIVIYNGISPNGDGINDTWIIEGLEHYPGSEVFVFDKFGDKVFEQTDYKNDWAGTGKKGTIPDGTYYYLVKLNSDEAPGGRDTFTGSLLFKR